MGAMAAMRCTEAELSVRLGRPPKAQDLTQQMDAAACPLHHDHAIGCMDLWELCCGYRGIPQDKGQRLGVLMLREERRSLRLRRLFHVRTRWMLAGMLNKFVDCSC